MAGPYRPGRSGRPINALLVAASTAHGDNHISAVLVTGVAATPAATSASHRRPRYSGGDPSLHRRSRRGFDTLLENGGPPQTAEVERLGGETGSGRPTTSGLEGGTDAAADADAAAVDGRPSSARSMTRGSHTDPS